MGIDNSLASLLGYAGSKAGLTKGGSMGIPWLAIALLGSAILPELFSKEDDLEDYEKRAREAKSLARTMGLSQGYESPYAKKLDPAVANMLLQRVMRTSGWGWPAGMGTDNSMISTLLQQIASGQINQQGIIQPSSQYLNRTQTGEKETRRKVTSGGLRGR